MHITKIKIVNYKSIKNSTIYLNEGMNIFVGENDAGKSTILEAISAVLLGRINNQSLSKALKPSLFNYDVRSNYIDSVKKYYDNPSLAYPSLPEIYIEVFLNDYPDYQGMNNSLGEDIGGIQLRLSFDSLYESLYKNQLDKKQIEDIPTEFYNIKLNSFKGEALKSGYLPIKTVFIDTSKKDYSSVIDRLVLNSLSEVLTEEEISILASEYKLHRSQFMKNKIMEELNDSQDDSLYFDSKKLQIQMKDMHHDDWKKELTLSIDNQYFDNLGLGTQNRIKVQLLLREKAASIDFILMEEPENNLSYSNMSKLITKISEAEGKQFFISTHSSYVINKLSLNNILLVKTGEITRLDELSKDTLEYF